MSAGGFLAIVQLIVYYVKLSIPRNPRAIYDIKFGPHSVAWGTLFPAVTLLTVISQFTCIPQHFVADYLYSPWLLFHRTCHQWSCCSYLLPVLPTLQIPLLVPIHSITCYGHWRFILSSSHAACIRGLVYPTNMSLCTVLPRSGCKKETNCSPRGHSDGNIDSPDSESESWQAFYTRTFSHNTHGSHRSDFNL